MAESDFTKASNVQRSFFIDWRINLIKSWGAARRYGENEIVRAPTGTGFYYKVIGSASVGISAQIQPAWKVEAGQTFKDGSVIWTVFHPDSAGLFTITSSIWNVDSGITHVSDQIIGFFTEVVLDDGVDGEQYRGVNDIITSTGIEAQDSIIVGIEDLAPL